MKITDIFLRMTAMSFLESAVGNAARSFSQTPSLIYRTATEIKKDPLARSNFMMSYPSKNATTLPDPSVTLEIGQQVIDQFFNEDFLHLVVDKMSNMVLFQDGWAVHGWKAPVLGKGSFVLDNVQIMKARLEEFQPPSNKVKVTETTNGGQFFDNRNKKSSSKNDQPVEMPVAERSKTIAFLNEKTMRISLKGLNMVASADYKITNTTWLSRGFKQKGKFWIRVVNAVIIMDIEPVPHPETSEPYLRFTRDPVIYFGQIKVRFDSGDSTKSLQTALVNSILKRVKDTISKSLAWAIKTFLPDPIGMIFKSISKSIVTSTDSFLTGFGLALPKYPRLDIRDLRWSVRDYQLLVRLNLLHITDDQRKAIAELHNLNSVRLETVAEEESDTEE